MSRLPRATCRHLEGSLIMHREVGIYTMWTNVCALCGELLSMGESNDAPVAVEIRAAEIAALRPIVIRDHELLGWRASNCGDAPFDSTEEAGWLGNIIYTHSEDSHD